MEDAARETGVNYAKWGKEEREEDGVLSRVLEAGLGRACKVKAVEA